jgi:nitronate monooxygenase
MVRMDARDLFGTELPIIQAPMAGSQDEKLALAVARAGALGSVPCAMLAGDALEHTLAGLARHDASINLNFFCHQSPTPDEARERRYRELLAPYYRELQLDPTQVTSAPARLPFSAEVAEQLELYKPRVVSFHFGLPAPELVSKVKRWGATVLSTATTLAEARWLEERGVDAIIAQGLEAGGHRGIFLSHDLATQVGTLALVQQIARNVRVPVIAAGGIVDAPGVAAARALGAFGVQVGTAYLLAPEANTSEAHRRALSSGEALHTAITNLFTGRPARGIVNRLMRELGPLRDALPEFPAAAALVTPLRQAQERLGSGDFSPLWAGQAASLCKVQSAADLTRELSRGL